MKLGIINSAFQQAGVDTATGLQHIARIGFDCVDIFTEAMTISLEEKRIIAGTCEKEDIPIVSVPMAAIGLIDYNQPVREFHVDPLQAVHRSRGRVWSQEHCAGLGRVHLAA